MTHRWFDQRQDGLILRIRLSPKASMDRIDGPQETADGVRLQVRVRAVPEDGKANMALLSALAKALSVPKRNLTLESGSTSRLKTIFVAGDAEQLLNRMSVWTKGT